jgi:MFS family permease
VIVLGTALAPTATRGGRFVAAVMIDAVGTGVFIPVSMLYFVATTSMSLVQVGAALTTAALLALPAGLVAGGLVDRYGARPVLQVANLVQAVGFAGYLVAGQAWQVTLCAWLSSAGRATFFGGYGVTVAALAEPGQRERWFGLIGSVRNLGYALGGVLSAVALGVGTTSAYATIVMVNALSYLAAFALMRGVPNARAEHRPDDLRGWRSVLRDRRYLLLVAQQLCFAISLFALNVLIPVYATRTLGLPGWTAGALFTLNAVLVGVGQGFVVARLTGQVRSRVLAAGHLLFATGYLIFLSAGRVSAPSVVLAVVLLGVVVYTLGEIFGAPVTAAVAADAAPAPLRGRYLALNQLAVGVAGAVAPVALSALLSVGDPVPWLTLIGTSLLGAALATVAGRVVVVTRRRIGEAAVEHEHPVEPSGPAGSSGL